MHTMATTKIPKRDRPKWRSPQWEAPLGTGFTTLGNQINVNRHGVIWNTKRPVPTRTRTGTDSSSVVLVLGGYNSVKSAFVGSESGWFRDWPQR
jgi:hypothetical protein